MLTDNELARIACDIISRVQNAPVYARANIVQRQLKEMQSAIIDKINQLQEG